MPTVTPTPQPTATNTPAPTATPTPLVVIPPELTFEGQNGSVAIVAWGQTVSIKVGQIVMLRWFVKNANRCDASYSPLTPVSSWTGPQLASIYEKQKYLKVASANPSTRVLYLKCYNSVTPTVFTQKSVTINVIQ